MKDIDAAKELLHACQMTNSEYYQSVMMDAYSEILWLRKEARMWRYRATQAASGVHSEARPANSGEVLETQP